MKENKTYKKLEELLSEPKSRKFLDHLVRAYLPIEKTSKVFEKPKKGFRCVLTHAPLISISEALEGINSETFKEDFMTHLKSWASGDNNAQIPMVKMLKGRVLGFTGEDTTTYISQEACQDLLDWVGIKILQGDKHINWLVKSTLRNHFKNKGESISFFNEKKGLPKRPKLKNNIKPTTNSLGDFDALKKLKEELEIKENQKK